MSTTTIPLIEAPVSDEVRAAVAEGWKAYEASTREHGPTDSLDKRIADLIDKQVIDDPAMHLCRFDGIDFDVTRPRRNSRRSCRAGVRARATSENFEPSFLRDVTETSGSLKGAPDQALGADCGGLTSFARHLEPKVEQSRSSRLTASAGANRHGSSAQRAAPLRVAAPDDERCRCGTPGYHRSSPQ